MAPGLGTKNADPQLALAQVNALLLCYFGHRQRVGRRRAQDIGTQVHDQGDLAFGRTTRHRHHRRTQALGAVMRAQAPGKQTIAVGIVNDVTTACAGRMHGARHQARPVFDIGLGVANDRGLAGGAAGCMDACHIFQGTREHAKGIGVAQIGLVSEGNAPQIVGRAHLFRNNPGLIEAPSVQFHVIVGIAQRCPEAIKLQVLQRVARHGFGCGVEVTASACRFRCSVHSCLLVVNRYSAFQPMAKLWLVIVGIRFVIAGLTRNPVSAWHWIPDRVRDDRSRVRDDKPQLRDDIEIFATSMFLRGSDTTHRHLEKSKTLVVAGTRHQRELEAGARGRGAGAGQRQKD